MADFYSATIIDMIFTTIREILQISGTAVMLPPTLEMETFPLMERETYPAQAQPSKLIKSIHCQLENCWKCGSKSFQ